MLEDVKVAGNPYTAGSNTDGSRIARFPDHSNRDSEPTLGELFVLLSEDLSALFHKEIELVRTEANEKIEQATGATTSLMLGGIFALLGGGAILAAAVLALGSVFIYWLSALLLGGLVLLIGLILLQNGRTALRSINLVPARTLHSLRQDTESILEKLQ